MSDAMKIDLEMEIDLLRNKLQRVRDLMKFEANSDGGLVAEIDHLLQVTLGAEEGEVKNE